MQCYVIVLPPQASSFDMYVSFCENKPQADALLWGYARPFFEVRMWLPHPPTGIHHFNHLYVAVAEVGLNWR